MHGFLRHQKIPYTIFVIEQIGNGKFNRGSLLNAGFLEVSKFEEYHCFILHDVDKLPEDDRILYTCGQSPAHLSPLLSTFNYKLLYNRFFGGVVTFTRKQFQKINGFSNLYEGWGGEDDDLFMRVEQSGYKLNRSSLEIGRYYAIQHEIDNLNEINPHRHKLLETAEKRFKTDGLNSVKYKVTQSKSMYGGLVYWISVNFPDKKEE
ncbi:Beta-1,4-N-acetylgalactosaminyltransferase bre-4 [Schistosoma japonicum]|nr:Beta-1,4-N-acetylgalactosaminyltransferase bre-4 [Schistosoma japonicum]